MQARSPQRCDKSAYNGSFEGSRRLLKHSWSVLRRQGYRLKDNGLGSLWGSGPVPESKEGCGCLYRGPAIHSYIDLQTLSIYPSIYLSVYPSICVCFHGISEFYRRLQLKRQAGNIHLGHAALHVFKPGRNVENLVGHRFGVWAVWAHPSWGRRTVRP